MEKKELIEKFDALEKEILKLVHLPEINLDETAKKQSIKSAIKKHIIAVEKAKVLFEEYEALAIAIEEFDKPKSKKAETAVAEKEKTEDKKESESYEDKLEVDGTAVKVTKKKKSKTSAKQM